MLRKKLSEMMKYLEELDSISGVITPENGQPPSLGLPFSGKGLVKVGGKFAVSDKIMAGAVTQIDSLSDKVKLITTDREDGSIPAFYYLVIL